jgi:simple sugar transport system substrate-binding protein
MGKTWKQEWAWLGPDWKDINNPDSSTVGFMAGAAMPPQVKQDLDAFIGAMASGRLNLFKGPLNYQDGKPFAKAGEIAGDRQIWYMEQLLEGMSGQSSTKK